MGGPGWEPPARPRRKHAPTDLSVRPGHGRSADIDGDYGYPRGAADTVAYPDAAGLESAHIAGFSAGAIIGLLLTLEHPARARPMSSRAGAATAASVRAPFRR
jgi:pimeloyl-ACP methyl ester carboxylesterase